MNGVKKIALTFVGSRPCNRLAVSLLSTPAEQAPTGSVLVDLLSAADVADKGPPEWVRFLAPGLNTARDGRKFTVADPEAVVQLSMQWKGATDLVIDWEHQTDLSKINGQKAEAAAWIKQLAAKGPDGTPGIWAQVDWLPDTAALIRAKKYRYLSAVVAHDQDNVVRLVPRASLTNTPAMDTATALFTTEPKEPQVDKLLAALLAALGLPATTTSDDAIKFVTLLNTFGGALAKSAGVELSVLSAMTADQARDALAKPLVTKLALFSTTAGLAADAEPAAIIAALQAKAVDPEKYVPKAIYDDVTARLAALNAEATAGAIEQAAKEGRLTPKMAEFAKTLTPGQLTAYLAAQPVIVKPGPEDTSNTELSTLTADEKKAALASGVTEEAFLAAKKQEAEETARRKAQLG